jgi:hypothetical protein
MVLQMAKAQELCDVADCTREHYSRRLCLKHYQVEWRRRQKEPDFRLLEDAPFDIQDYWLFVQKELGINGTKPK